VRDGPVLVDPATTAIASPSIELILRETNIARQYDVMLGDEVIAAASRNPMKDSAEVLLERGEPRSTVLEFRFGGVDLGQVLCAVGTLLVQVGAHERSFPTGREGPARSDFGANERPFRERSVAEHQVAHGTERGWMIPFQNSVRN
jgi:hypothetical protein